jgi:hypothetical protein
MLVVLRSKIVGECVQHLGNAITQLGASQTAPGNDPHAIGHTIRALLLLQTSLRTSVGDDAVYRQLPSLLQNIAW